MKQSGILPGDNTNKQEITVLNGQEEFT